VVICLERDVDLHMAQLSPLPLTVSCFSKVQICFTFLVLAHPGISGKGLLNGCVYVTSSFAASPSATLVPLALSVFAALHIADITAAVTSTLHL